MTSFLQIDTSHPLYAQVYDLREAVLRVPLGLSLKNEDLSGDAYDQVFVALEAEDRVVACLMLHYKGEGRLKMRQMAVRADLQGKGIGQALVRFSENAAATLGCRIIELHAREFAVTFYEKLGYERSGDTFQEVGIPHVYMEKRLPDAHH